MKRHIVISSNDASPFSTQISGLDGEPILGVRNVDIALRAGKPNTATLEFLSAFFGAVEANFCVCDPVSGKLKPVERILFADGTSYPPAEEGSANV